MSEYLVLIRADRTDLVEPLRSRFAADSRVEVILDRRVAERRSGRGPAGLPEQRRDERRRPQPWTPLGFVIPRETGAEPVPANSVEDLERTLRRLLSASTR
jgi:hypothetical protein